MKTKYPIILLSIAALISTSPIVSAENETSTQPSASLISQSNSQKVSSLLFMFEQKILAHDVFTTLHQHWQKRRFAILLRTESRHLRAIKRRLQNNGLTDQTLNNSTGVFNNSELQELYWELVDRGQNSVLDALHVSAFIKEMDIVNLQSVIDTSEKTKITRFYQKLMSSSKKHLSILIKQIEKRGGVYKPQEMSEDELNTMPDEVPVAPIQDELNTTPDEVQTAPDDNDAQFTTRFFTSDEVIRLNAIVRRSLDAIEEFDSIRRNGTINDSQQISRIRGLAEQARSALTDYVIAEEEIRAEARDNNEIFNDRARQVFAGQSRFVEDINRELSSQIAEFDAVS
ncbi:MAG: DUF2202 domain-containing protein [Gammaproteobacteria bacterium]|nr:DUF2202 domain-containing protein [Gammaproteobacteria bacterium]